MRLTNMFCDGCGRTPSFWEWVRGELSAGGYENWRHPGIPFKAAGCPIVYENNKRAQRMFQALFQRPMPDELSYLCPQCGERAELELPAMVAADPGDVTPPPPPSQNQAPRHHFG